MDISTLSQATEVAPGLVVFRLAPDHKPHNPQRWRISHKSSGLAIADSMQHENALKGAALLAKVTDWTQDADTVKAAVDREDLFAQQRTPAGTGRTRTSTWRRLRQRPGPTASTPSKSSSR